MSGTTVVFVHGFVSTPDCWSPFHERLKADVDVISRGFSFLFFKYPTKFLQLDITRRIPSIKECGAALGDFIDNEAPEGRLMLVGHSMGGLVIQSYLAGKIGKGRAKDLERIRSVIMFATPNRGSTILSTVRKIFSWLRDNEQEAELQVLDQEVADTSEVIVRSVLDTKKASEITCPIPFRVFWGLEDNIVPEVSAKGPFLEASPLEGDHHTILQPPDPKAIPKNSVEARDQRYPALKSALLNPVGHPAIYEIARFEVNLCIAPFPAGETVLLKEMTNPIPIQPDNVADREIKVVFAKQNRCCAPYDQMYRSEKGYVEFVAFDGVNEAADETMSEYYSTGKKYTCVFSPDQGSSYSLKLKIYDGFGDGQRSWHNHMKLNANYKLFRLTLNLKAYQEAKYEFAPEPLLYFHPQKILDHNLCGFRKAEEILAPVSSTDPWLRSWEVADVDGGVIDVVWDVKKPAALQQP